MKNQIDEFEKMKYIINYPDKYDKKTKYPVLFFLHGAGTRGDDIGLLENNQYFITRNEFKDFPFVTIAPQCSKNTWFDVFETLQRFVLHCLEFDFVDKSKVYVMGSSMGGYATWQLAMSMPDCFAAIVPICGGGMYWNAGRLVNVPVWAFHGKKDQVVFVQESEKMVDAVNSNGGNALLTVYPENTHDAWSDTYKNPEVYKWLLSKSKNNVNELVDKYNDSTTFG